MPSVGAAADITVVAEDSVITCRVMPRGASGVSGSRDSGGNGRGFRMTGVIVCEDGRWSSRSRTHPSACRTADILSRPRARG
jgi:hypothetical protein